MAILVKGEITIVLKGIERNKLSYGFNKLELKKELTELINAGLSLSSASKYLAKKTNLSKSFIYKMY